MRGLVGSLLGGFREAKAVVFETAFLNALRPASKSGASVNLTTALECTTVLACVQVIACGVAMLPLDIYRPLAGGGREIARDEGIWSFFSDQPNEWQTWPEWIETTLLHAVLCGDGVAFKNRGLTNGPIRELIPLIPGTYSIERRDDHELLYHITLDQTRSLTVRRDDVFHLRGPSWNAYSGLDATQAAREAIGLALTAEEAHARLHSNGSRPGGVLATEQRLTQDQVNDLRAAWAQSQGGVANSMKTAILSGGLKFQPMSMTGVDAQHIETRRFQIEEICRAFGVYPAMIGHADKASTFASAEQFFLANVIYTLGRWTRRFEERVRVDLFSKAERRAGLFAKFSLQALLRGDAKTRAEFYTALITIGVLTRNEARALEDLNPLPGLDEPLLPLNMAGGPPPPALGETPPEIEAKARAIAALARSLGSDTPDLEDRIGRVLRHAGEAP